MEIQTSLMRTFRKVATADKLTEEDLLNWAKEAINRYREIGLVAFVDALNVEVDEDDNAYLSPIVAITGRLEDSEFDFDQAQHETQHGLADGVEGRINEKGVWLPPKTTM